MEEAKRLSFSFKNWGEPLKISMENFQQIKKGKY